MKNKMNEATDEIKPPPFELTEERLNMHYRFLEKHEKYPRIYINGRRPLHETNLPARRKWRFFSAPIGRFRDFREFRVRR